MKESVAGLVEVRVHRFIGSWHAVSKLPMLMNLHQRFHVMGTFEDFEQILSLTTPSLESNFSTDGFAERGIDLAWSGAMTSLRDGCGSKS